MEWEREGKRNECIGCAHEKFLFLVVGPPTDTLPPPTEEQKKAVSMDTRAGHGLEMILS